MFFFLVLMSRRFQKVVIPTHSCDCGQSSRLQDLSSASLSSASQSFRDCGSCSAITTCTFAGLFRIWRIILSRLSLVTFSPPTVPLVPQLHRLIPKLPTSHSWLCLLEGPRCGVPSTGVWGARRCCRTNAASVALFSASEAEARVSPAILQLAVSDSVSDSPGEGVSPR